MVFKHLDSHDNNYLTKDDLKAAMERMNIEISLDDIEDLIDTYDIENKGKITFELFKHIMIEDIKL